MRIPGAIIAGGKGTRLGGDKPLCPFLKATLLDAVVARALPQVGVLAINVPRTSLSLFRAHFGDTFEFLYDLEGEDVGPLNGILSGLQWAERLGATWLATFPADTPFLPGDLVTRLLAAAIENVTPATACDAAGLHGLCAVWPVDKCHRLLEGVRVDRVRSLSAALEMLNAVQLLFDDESDAFFNVNTPDDLARAEHIAATGAR